MLILKKLTAGALAGTRPVRHKVPQMSGESTVRSKNFPLFSVEVIGEGLREQNWPGFGREGKPLAERGFYFLKASRMSVAGKNAKKRGKRVIKFV